jgi:membrane-bound lytic murein transglycosylase D
MYRSVILVLLTAAAAGAAPLPENLAARRAVRGSAIEPPHEAEELRQQRELDHEWFPPPPPSLPRRDDDQPTRSPSLWDGIGPDSTPAELRSPTRSDVGPDERAASAAIPWLSELKLPDIPVRMDPRVVRYLEFYKDDKRGRAIMSSWLRKQGRYRALFEGVLAKAKLPLSLIYVSMIESSYDPHDRSGAGAVGLWQFMPENSRIYGLRVDYWVDERKDPEKSTRAFAQYMIDLRERFGAWPLILGAFDAGYGAVLHAMQKYNTNDYWELCRHEDGLPWETTLYVPKAMAAAIVGANRKLFGYDDIQPDPPYGFDRVSVPSSMSVQLIARAAGVSAAEVAALNPELRRGRTPPEGGWQARVPHGVGARFLAAQQKEAVEPFVVRFGERLEDIAAAHGITLRELRALNGVDDSAEVHPGLTLVVPSGKSPLPPPSDIVIVAVPDKEAQVSGRKRIFYRTLPQDSPTDIATFFKVKPTDLARWNNLDLEAKLANNMVLQIWVAPDFDVSKAALVDASRVRVVTCGSPEFFELVEARRGRKRLTYVVKKGDDLKHIAKKYKLTVADLERINRFSASHTDLVVGQKLTVYVGMTPAEKAKATCAITPGGTTPEPAAPSAPRADDKKPAAPVDDSETEAAPSAGDALSSSTPLPRPPPPDGKP